MEHIPGALLLHEIMWDSAHSWRRLQVRQNTYFCTVDNGDCILCTIKHLWIWTCWTNCTVFFMSICKVQTYIQRARKRCDMDCISDLRVYSVWDVTWIALVISSDLCSVWQFHIFHIAMTGCSLLSPCSVFLPNYQSLTSMPIMSAVADLGGGQGGQGPP